MTGTWRDSVWRRLQVRIIGAVGYLLVGLLGRTLRWRVDGWEHFAALEGSAQPPILGFWHGRILSATYYFRGRGIVVITSENFDGEWIARIIERFGYGTARGSGSRSATRALLQLKREVGRGRSVGFTLDGPRGPARRSHPGAVWLSSATGSAVLPFHFEATRSWTIRSWDRTQIPKPFSLVALAIGEPLFVPGLPEGADLERWCRDLDARLEALEARCRGMLGSRS